MTKDHEAPAEGIYVTRRFEDAVFMSVPCQCGDGDDTIEFSVEIEHGIITIHQYSIQKTAYWDKKVVSDHDDGIAGAIQANLCNFINSLWHRLAVTWEVWVHGKVRYHQYTVLSEQQALNYAKALTDAIETLRE